MHDHHAWPEQSSQEMERFCIQKCIAISALLTAAAEQQQLILSC
jgi:hypothetical protein